jgi:hypothetical protein
MVYSYDFNRFNETSGREFEVFTDAAWDPFSLSLFLVPAQPSTRNDLTPSSYWIEFNGSGNVGSLAARAGFQFGTYSSRFLNPPRREAVGYFTMSASKALGEQTRLAWNITVPMNRGLTGHFWMSLGYSF